MKAMKLFIIIAAIMALLPLRAFSNTNVVDDVLPGGILVFGDFQARLTGLDVPGLDHKLGMEIWDFTKRAVHGKTVKMATWTTNNMASGIVRDDDGYAFVNIEYGNVGHEKGASISLNEQLLKKGYAQVDEEHLPDFCQHYKDLEQQAKEAGLGIWEK